MTLMTDTKFSSLASRSCALAVWLFCVGILFFPFLQAEQNGESGETKARNVIQAAIAALGGDKYLSIKNVHHSGRYFVFGKRGLRGFVRYWDWTTYQPIKSRFQMGEGKRQEVEIYNLELRKAWKLEGKNTVEEKTEEDIKRWEKSVRKDVNVLLKTRLNEEGLSLFYYGPKDISGSGNYEAVEFLDAMNNSVVVYFGLDNHLPMRVEYESRDRLGILQKREQEFINWHTIAGVQTPLRSDSYTDGKLSGQVHLEEISYNVDIPSQYFLEPQVEKKE